MRGGLVFAAIFAMAAGFLPGCHWAGKRGPVPQSLLTSRQYAQEGVAAMEKEQWSQAEAKLAEAVKACPNNSEARQHYAESLWRRGARREALAQLEEACRLSPHDAELQAKAAELLASLGQLTEARARAEKAVTMDPKLPAAFAARARVSWTSGQLREALADYHRALCFAPEDRRLLQDTATLYQALNEPYRALATLQSLADTYGTGDEPQPLMLQLGDSLERTGRFDDAAAQYMAALARGPQSADLFFRLARVEDQLNHAGAAERALERAVAMDPNHQPSREMLNRIQIARQGGDSTLRR